MGFQIGLREGTSLNVLPGWQVSARQIYSLVAFATLFQTDSGPHKDSACGQLSLLLQLLLSPLILLLRLSLQLLRLSVVFAIVIIVSVIVPILSLLL